MLLSLIYLVSTVSKHTKRVKEVGGGGEFLNLLICKTMEVNIK